MTYRWVQLTGPPATIRTPNADRTDVTGVTGPTSLSFQVTVTDDVGQVATDTVTVTVNAPPSTEVAPPAGGVSVP